MADEREQLRRWFEHEQRHPRQAILQALDSLGLENGDRVVDIGCGPGVHLRHFHQRVAPDGAVVGIDPNAERLEVAGSLLADEVERGQIELVEGDLHNPDESMEKFDLVWLSLVLHHEAVPAEGIQDAAALVKPGGRLAIMDGDGMASFPFLPWPVEVESRLRQAVLRASQGDGSDISYRFQHFTGRHLASALAESGLVNVQVSAFSDVRQSPLDDWDRNDIQDWFINSFGRRIRHVLAPVDWQEFAAYFEPDSPTYMLDDPHFFMIRTWVLAVGTVE